MMSKTTFRIGFSGHQQIGDESTIQFVSQQLRDLLAAYQQMARDKGQEMVACSALAMGADQLFVKTALELGIPVEVVIPCAKYAEIFPTSEALEEYHRLLNSCQDVHSFCHLMIVQKMPILLLVTGLSITGIW